MTIITAKQLPAPKPIPPRVLYEDEITVATFAYCVITGAPMTKKLLDEMKLLEPSLYKGAFGELVRMYQQNPSTFYDVLSVTFIVNLYEDMKQQRRNNKDWRGHNKEGK
jgi:hypothetical protein